MRAREPSSARRVCGGRKTPVASGDASFMLHFHFSRIALALGALAPFVMSGCASIPLADDASQTDAIVIAAAAATAATREAQRGNAPGNA
ncbi:MAG: hypothetical protein M3R40_06530, partial [Pseudomonadota bacterium]|nr:hypothetical protein [Pseudomonadota bacterium]